jgi:hypothetical protein
MKSGGTQNAIWVNKWVQIVWASDTSNALFKESNKNLGKYFHCSSCLIKTTLDL